MSNNLNEFFSVTDYQNLKITPEQSLLMGKDIQLVKGSDYHKNIYDIPDSNNIQDLTVRYYQIAIFDEFGKCSIRSFLFKGETSKGACFYNYKMIEIKDYSLAKNKIDTFVKYLEKQQKLNIKNFKIMFKFHPVYNFEYTNPPTGNDINQCQSELLN